MRPYWVILTDYFVTAPETLEQVEDCRDTLQRDENAIGEAMDSAYAQTFFDYPAARRALRTIDRTRKALTRLEGSLWNDEGEYAFSNGVAIDANPFDKANNPQAFRAWRNGWLLSQRMAKQSMLSACNDGVKDESLGKVG